MSRRDKNTQVANGTPFDNASNGFVADNTQAAIEEVVTKLGPSRFVAICGFDGTASSGRYLEFFGNVPSSTTPFTIAEAGTLKSISVALASNGTVTFTVYRNGASIETLVLSSEAKKTKLNLAHALSSLDQLSVSVTSGSGSKPVFNLFIQTSS